MRQPASVEREFNQIGTIEDLTSIFEAIASVHIAQVKDKVLSSTSYFNELWKVYSQLRVSKEENSRLSIQHTNRTALVAVTSDGGLIGDIDDRIVQALSQVDRSSKPDVFVVGTHGAALLSQRGIQADKVFAAPDVEKGDSVRRLAQLLGAYEHATVYYQTYVSLTRQDVARIDLFSAVQVLGQEIKASDEIISSRSYIFEPSAKEVVGYMEAMMLGIALGQVLLESKLAQYASRFNAMYAAKTKAKKLQEELGLQLHRAKRAVTDERTKEILSGRKAIKQRRAAG